MCGSEESATIPDRRGNRVELCCFAGVTGSVGILATPGPQGVICPAPKATPINDDKHPTQLTSKGKNAGGL